MHIGHEADVSEHRYGDHRQGMPSDSLVRRRNLSVLYIYNKRPYEHPLHPGLHAKCNDIADASPQPFPLTLPHIFTQLQEMLAHATFCHCADTTFRVGELLAVA